MTTPNGPIVGWEVPTEEAGYGVGDIAREAWRIVRAQAGPLVAIAAIPTILIMVLYVPLWVSLAATLDGMISFWADLDMGRYLGDPEGFQRDMTEAMRPAQDLSLLTSISTGIAVIVGMVAFGAETAGTLEAADGRRPSVAGAFRTALRRPAVVIPAVLLGLGYLAVLVPLSLAQPGFLYGGAGLSVADAGVSIVLSVVTIAIEIVVVYLAVRWAVYFQVAITEGLGIRASLARAAELSHGIRIRIALALILLTVLIGLVAILLALIPGLILGFAASSVVAGVVAATVGFSLLALVYLPLYAAALTYIYRRRREREVVDPGPSSEPMPASDPAGPTG